MEIEQFLDRLASPAATPGGGSASALAGALSASLVAMVAGLSIEKGKLQKKEAMDIRKRALSIQKRLLRAADEDARSFDGVMAAFRLPRATEKQRLRRSAMIQRAYQKATVPPAMVCEESIELLRFCRTLTSKGNPNAWSDTGVAGYLAKAALEGGILNIRINLASIEDKSFKKRMEGLVNRLRKKRDRLIEGHDDQYAMVDGRG